MSDKSAVRDGGPAFPVSWSDGDGQIVATPGMTLRDYFAGQALIGLIVNPVTLHPDVPLSARAYEIADAMLAARSPTGETREP